MEKKPKLTTIAIEEDLASKLMILKKTMGFKNMNELIWYFYKETLKKITKAV